MNPHPNEVSRRQLGRIAAALALAAAGMVPHGIATAQAYPAKPVRLIVPYAVGGSTDQTARLIARSLSTRLGQQVVVENRAGAGGALGHDAVAKAPADGYTLLQGGEGITLNAILFPNLPYRTDEAFAPLIKAVVNPQILVVNPKTGIASLAEYIQRARTRPQSISLALPGNGGIAHVAHELLTQQTGARVNYIPYAGGGPATVDVLAGHVDATLITLAAVTDYVRLGRLRALAVTTPYRSQAVPDVPTMAEAGVPGFSVESWQGYFAPAHTPAPVLARIHRDIEGVLRTPEMRERLEDMGFKVAGGSSAELATSLRSERERYQRVIETARIALQ
jgi:tripartite-type tricarboxylate transporter receptor subunit TctC